MDWQYLLNLSIGAIAVMMGWIWSTLSGRLERLQQTDDQLRDKISEIHVLVAGQYVKNEALDKFSDAVMIKLDKIESRLYQMKNEDI